MGAIIPGWLKLVGGVIIAGAIVWGAAWVTSRIDRAAQADQVETDAKAAVADANAKRIIAEAQTEALKVSMKQAETDRATADAVISQRENANAILLESLRQRIAAASAPAGACNYRPDARQLLVDAWRRAPGGYFGDKVPGPADEAPRAP